MAADNTSKGTVSGNTAGSKQSPSQMPSPWSMVGNAADAIGGIFPEASNYKGTYGNISAGLDSAFDQASDIAMQINPMIGGIMKGASLLNKGIAAVGGATDGMTRGDAISDSIIGRALLGPLSLINSFGAKKSNTMELDNNTWSMAGDSYAGAANTAMQANEKSGKKYGLIFGQKGLRDANEEINNAGRMQNTMAGIVDYNKMKMDALANQQDMNNQQYFNMMNGIDWSNMALSAKKGGILPSAYQIAHRVAYRHKKKEEHVIPEFVPQMIHDQTIDMFQNGGQMSLLPEGALHKDKHHIEEMRDDLKGEITHKGIPVVTIAKDGKQVEQVAEIEHSEWILSADLTDKIEKLRDQYNKSEDSQEKLEFAIEAGKLISDEIMENTDDRVGLIKKIKV